MKRIAIVALALLSALGCEERDALVSGVDLRVTALEIPFATELALGATVPVQVTVRNHGTVGVSDQCELKLEFYEAPSFAAADELATMPALTYDFPTGITAATSQDISINMTVNLGLTPTLPDLVFVRAWFYVVGNSGIDVDHSNDAAFAVFQVVAGGSSGGGGGTVDQPDLTLNSYTVAPAVQRGQELDVVLVVGNIGGQTTGSGFDVTVEGFEDASYTTSLWPEQLLRQGILSQNSSTDVTFTFDVAPDDPIATVYLRVRIDSDDWDTDADREVVEANEGNNEFDLTTSVTYPDSPDLTVVVTGGSTHFEIDDTSAKMSIEYTITNEGNTDAGACLAGYWLRGPLPDGTWSQDLNVLTQVPPLASGETWDGSETSLSTATVPELGKSYELVVVVDAGSDVLEENENNNEGTQDVLIYSNAQADLTASVVSVTQNVSLSGSGVITIRYRIDNIGTGVAGQSTTHLELWRKSSPQEWVAGWLTAPVTSVAAGGYDERLQDLHFFSVPAFNEDYYIKVIADGSLQVAETEEDNNTVDSADIYITP